jgi:HEAT repeat protein
MTRRAWLLNGWQRLGCLLAVCSLVAPVFGQNDDPAIGDKPLSELLKQLRSENRGFQVRAARALSEAPEELRAAIIPKVIPLLKSERENDRFVAAQTLGNYGPVARAAVPDLIPVLKGTQYERNRAAAAKALGQILKDAQPGDEAEQVTQALVVLFEDSYDDVRREAVAACGMIGPAAKSCIPHLTDRLKDWPRRLPDDGTRLVRKAAAWTCGRMGPLAAQHVDLIITRLHSEGDTVPEMVEALGLIGPVRDNMVPNIIDKLERVDLNVGYELETQSYIALKRFGPKAMPALSFLMRILRNTPDNRVRIEPLIAATKVIGAIGPEAKEAVPLLEKMTTYQSHGHAQISKEKHDELHAAAKAALAAVTGKEK